VLKLECGLTIDSFDIIAMNLCSMRQSLNAGCMKEEWRIINQTRYFATLTERHQFKYLEYEINL